MASLQEDATVTPATVTEEVADQEVAPPATVTEEVTDHQAVAGPSTPSKQDKPATPVTPTVPAFRLTPPPDPETPRQMKSKIVVLNSLVQRNGRRNQAQQDDLATAVRELRRLTALFTQNQHRVQHQQQRAELDEAAILLDEEIDII